MHDLIRLYPTHTDHDDPAADARKRRCAGYGWENSNQAGRQLTLTRTEPEDAARTLRGRRVRMQLTELSPDLAAIRIRSAKQ